MDFGFTSLTDPEAEGHREELEEVKRQLGITHGYLDAWLYGFLENKKFDVGLTIPKLQRRIAMESNDLARYTYTDEVRSVLRKGIIQHIGTDKQGREVIYLHPSRQHLDKSHYNIQRQVFDMMLSYGTRIRKGNLSCQMVMLINYKGASMSKNLSVGFDADMAIRVAKFYAGGVCKMYLCNMSSVFSAAVKAALLTAKKIVVERVHIIGEKKKKEGELLEYFEEDVLPMDLGGKNDCDHQEDWEASAQRIEEYFVELQKAVSERGIKVKEFELEDIGIDVKK